MAKKQTITDTGLIGSRLIAKVRLNHYRYPVNKVHVSGDFAIVFLDVEKVIEGNIPTDLIHSGSLVQIAVTGNMPRLYKDTDYYFQGVLKLDKTYGLQYENENLRLAYDMSNIEDQKKFFSFFMSDRQIDLLFAETDNPVEYLEQKNIGALTKIKGIGPVTASRMCMRYAENKDNGRAYIELKGLDLTKYAIDKLVKQFGSADVVVDIIKSNPYMLIRLVRGYGWEKADKIALSQGFTRDCKERCIAYAQYHLEEEANQNGNSCIDIEALMNSILMVCHPITRENAVAYLKENMCLQKDFKDLYKKIVDREIQDLQIPLFFYSKDDRKVGLFKLRLLEKQIVNHLQRLTDAYVSKSRTFDHSVCENIIDYCEREQGYEYTDEQKNAIWNILNNNVSILTGSSGCGKSSTLKPLIKIFERYNYKVEQCALSGRASSLLTEYTGLAGKTIHRLLGYMPETEKFSKTEGNPINADVIILDETSMVGEELFLDLISAIRSGARLIMLGDVKQLPPMSVGNILNDCLQSGYISTNILTKIHRQALKSGIIAQSLHVCEGKSIVANDFIGSELRGELKDFKIVSNPDKDVVHANIIDEFKHLYLDRHIPSDDIQIIVPIKSRGSNSCRAYNAEIQAIVNPTPTNQDITVNIVDGDQRYEVLYRPSDRIMVIHNNYHAMSIEGRDVAIFNGNMGHIVSIGSDTMLIDLDEQGPVFLPREEWNNIMHAWACTCHKLQGSQAPYVIVDMDYGSYKLLCREWLYTALTRARKYCVLVCQPQAVNLASRTSNIKQKQTFLKQDLHNLYLEKVGKEI